MKGQGSSRMVTAGTEVNGLNLHEIDSKTNI